jgi:hypothetical protein
LSLLVADNDQQTVLVATENGFGKRTALADFRHSGRGTQGVIAIAASERNGKVVAARLVRDDDEIMLITTGGVLIRTRVREIRELGRATQGVTLIALDAGEKLAGLEKVIETEDDAESPGQPLAETPEPTRAASDAWSQGRCSPCARQVGDCRWQPVATIRSRRRGQAVMNDDLLRELGRRQPADRRARRAVAGVAESAGQLCAAGRRDQGAPR